jgi:hypothetical protein
MIDFVENKTQVNMRQLVKLLSEFRQDGKLKEYRTTADSILILYGIYKREVFDSVGLVESVIRFVDTYLVLLETEISELDSEMNKLISSKRMREYREQLLSYEKLHFLKSRLLSDIHIKI